MPDDFGSLIDEAEDLTLRQLDSRISSLTRLKDTELNALFPKQVDKQRLVQLMQIVKDATSENTKRQALIDNISDLAGIVLRLLSKFV